MIYLSRDSKKYAKLVFEDMRDEPKRRIQQIIVDMVSRNRPGESLLLSSCLLFSNFTHVYASLIL